ncbi:hypothetical protein BK133_21310 [Paenibacillus sp. FSL H8-0548]|uniref:hypothetical protein n=1 Tax=Paenibacillus sp. FSL H8-0548 TaxID=1920422 RepID=UPI00096D8E77|nr:hypothetical protein [Paenibacillus sp. FSL H8-0548]OMF25632.1 hypothetical protein BK133_21310 [Paenibacillus sp. FSL H8-0548]
MNLRERTIGKFEIEALFRDVLNQSQIESVSKLLKLLGLYVFLEKSMLDTLAERHFGEKIGLSFIKKAVRYNLIAELQSEDDNDCYFFQLKTGGFIFLDDIGFKYRKLPLDASRKERSRLLAINEFLIDRKYLLSSDYGLALYEPLITTKEIVLHELFSEEETKQNIDSVLGGSKSREFTFYERMQLKEVVLNSKAKGNIDSLLA